MPKTKVMIKTLRGKDEYKKKYEEKVKEKYNFSYTENE